MFVGKEGMPRKCVSVYPQYITQRAMHRGLKGDNPTAVGQEFANSLSVMEPFILIGMSVDIRRKVPRLGTHVASCPNKVLRFLFKSTQKYFDYVDENSPFLTNSNIYLAPSI